jgi:FtsH-binding integral membrane protein
MLFLRAALVRSAGAHETPPELRLWAFRIAAVWVITALVALWVLLRQVPQATPVAFLLLTQITLFLLCMALAFQERQNPSEHMRWVILAMSQAIIGGIERLPIAATQNSYDRSALVALLFPLALFLYDAAIARHIYRASLVGGITILAVHLVRVPISQSAAWLAIAHRLASVRK